MSRLKAAGQTMNWVILSVCVSPAGQQSSVQIWEEVTGRSYVNNSTDTTKTKHKLTNPVKAIQGLRHLAMFVNVTKPGSQSYHLALWSWVGNKAEAFPCLQYTLCWKCIIHAFLWVPTLCWCCVFFSSSSFEIGYWVSLFSSYP